VGEGREETMDKVKAAVSVSVRTAAMRSKMEEWGVDGEFFVSFFLFRTTEI